MTTKKSALLSLAGVLLLAIGVYLGIRFIPAVWKATPAQPLPTITIEAMFPGASASVIAETVVGPIEQQVNGVEKMVSMRSRCGSDGSYSLTVTFQRARRFGPGPGQGPKPRCTRIADNSQCGPKQRDQHQEEIGRFPPGCQPIVTRRQPRPRLPEQLRHRLSQGRTDSSARRQRCLVRWPVRSAQCSSTLT